MERFSASGRSRRGEDTAPYRSASDCLTSGLNVRQVVFVSPAAAQAMTSQRDVPTTAKFLERKRCEISPMT